MTSTFFPINEITFVENFMDDINDINDWTSEYHMYIDNKVSYNSTDENIMIINEYAGGIYEALKLYKDEYGEIEITDDKHLFYAQLAFVSLYRKFYDECEERVNDIVDDCDEEDDDKIKEDIISTYGSIETFKTVVKKYYDENFKE